MQILLTIMISNLSSIRLNEILGNTVANEANEILKDPTIAIPLKYLSNVKDQFIGMNMKHKVRIKIWQMNINIFSNQTLQMQNCHMNLFLTLKQTTKIRNVFACQQI